MHSKTKVGSPNWKAACSCGHKTKLVPRVERHYYNERGSFGKIRVQPSGFFWFKARKKSAQGLNIQVMLWINFSGLLLLTKAKRRGAFEKWMPEEWIIWSYCLTQNMKRLTFVNGQCVVVGFLSTRKITLFWIFEWEQNCLCLTDKWINGLVDFDRTYF